MVLNIMLHQNKNLEQITTLVLVNFDTLFVLSQPETSRGQPLANRMKFGAYFLPFEVGPEQAK